MVQRLEYLRKFAPAALADAPATHVSDAYNFIPTYKLIEEFENKGWQIDVASQSNPRSRNPLTTKHRISMIHPNYTQGVESRLGSLRPRIEIINSHDWSFRFKIMLGMLRLVCTNGLVIGQSVLNIALRHDSPLVESVEMITDRFGTASDRVLIAAGDMSQKILSRSQQMHFAAEARNLRFGPDSTVEPESLLVARRPADEGDSVWNVYNRVQENVTMGGIRFPGMRRMSRRITNIQKDLDLNESLWNLAASF